MRVISGADNFDLAFSYAVKLDDLILLFFMKSKDSVKIPYPRDDRITPERTVLKLPYVGAVRDTIDFAMK